MTESAWLWSFIKIGWKKRPVEQGHWFLSLVMVTLIAENISENNFLSQFIGFSVVGPATSFYLAAIYDLSQHSLRQPAEIRIISHVMWHDSLVVVVPCDLVQVWSGCHGDGLEGTDQRQAPIGYLLVKVRLLLKGRQRWQIKVKVKPRSNVQKDAKVYRIKSLMVTMAS